MLSVAALRSGLAAGRSVRALGAMVSTDHSSVETHSVFNQSFPCDNYNAFDSDIVLQQAFERAQASWALEDVRRHGAAVASRENQAKARLANRYGPVLNAFDMYGRRVNEVEYHPAYHDCMQLGLRAGVAGYAWKHVDAPGAFSARGTLLFLQSQLEPGGTCPMVMTHSAVPALQHAPSLASLWLPRLTSLEYDPRDLPAARKRACLIGMSMTEKQGGSDVRANTTRAVPIGTDGAAFALTGHKFFTSAPMSAAFLTLAQTDAGLGCFLVPRWLESGERNAGFHVMRLKDKLGDRSNASSEVEYRGAVGYAVGQAGRGVATIINMVQNTRVDCAVGSAGSMRLATRRAIHHARNRSAFGARLVDKPAMQAVLADLAIESEAATLLAFRLLRAADAGKPAAAFARIATAIAKYWICKRQVGHAYEAMEVFGGTGFVEESDMPRLFRQSPLNAIWEGTGNVISLDVLRALAREPAAGEALRSELLGDGAASSHPLVGPFIKRAVAMLDALVRASPFEQEYGARALADRLGLALQAVELVRHAPPVLVHAWAHSRLAGLGRDNYGVLPAMSASELASIIDRAGPPIVEQA